MFLLLSKWPYKCFPLGRTNSATNISKNRKAKWWKYNWKDSCGWFWIKYCRLLPKFFQVYLPTPKKKKSCFRKCRWWEKPSPRRLQIYFFSQFFRYILFSSLVSFLYFCILGFLIVSWLFEIKKYILVHIRLCEQVTDKNFFTWSRGGGAIFNTGGLNLWERKEAPPWLVPTSKEKFWILRPLKWLKLKMTTKVVIELIFCVKKPRLYQ